jgi:hypothetical protein
MMHIVTCTTMATPGTRDRQRQSGTCRAAIAIPCKEGQGQQACRKRRQGYQQAEVVVLAKKKTDVAADKEESCM